MDHGILIAETFATDILATHIARVRRRPWHQWRGRPLFGSSRPASPPAAPVAEAAEEAERQPRFLRRQANLPRQTRRLNARTLHPTTLHEPTSPSPRFPRFSPTRTSS